MASADDATPAHARERPEWIDALLRFFKPLLKPHTSNLQVKGKIEALAAKSKDGSSDFTMQLPLSFLAVPVTSIPTVYPLRGQVTRTKDHIMSGEAPPFPPPGMMLEIALYKPVTPADIGTFERLNLDRHLFAWPMAFQDAALAANIKPADIATILRLHPG